MILVLKTIKEYCKIESITDGGARKRVKEKLVKSIILDENLYIVMESNEEELLKQKLKLANAKIKELRQFARAEERKNEDFKELKDRCKLLEEKIEMQRDSKEALYEKVIAHITNALPNIKE
jgi:hypothetical protein